jgi:hypothetical protein
VQEKAYITFGLEMGGVKAAEAVQPHLIELRRLLKKYCNKQYTNELDEIAPILRVDGDLWFFEFEGCEKLRLSKKYRYITIDIGMPRSKWEGVHSNHSRQDGVIGVDCNVDHLAVANINHKGQLIHSFTIPFNLENKTSSQIDKLLELVAIQLVDYTVKQKKPLVFEKLNTTIRFQRKASTSFVFPVAREDNRSVSLGALEANDQPASRYSCSCVLSSRMVGLS